MVLSLSNFARTVIATTTLTLLSAVLLCGSALSQDAEIPGMKELDKAFDKKINSKSTRDLDEVARLCEHCLLYTSPSPRDQRGSRMPSSA